jgi:hypothetical protein
MVYRKRLSAGRAWSLVMHLGIALVLVGAMVTLVFAQRGYVRVLEGKAVTHYFPAGQNPRTATPIPLGFSLKLVDFRLVHYPPVDYLFVQRPGAKRPDRYRIREGREVPVRGTGGTLLNLKIAKAPDLSMRFSYDAKTGVGRLHVTGEGETQWTVPADVGAVSELAGTEFSVEVLRFEPAFTRDNKTKTVTSRTKEPVNPAVQVVVRDRGRRLGGTAQWLFSRFSMPATGPMMHHRGHGGATLSGEAVTAAGTSPFRLEAGANAPCPWMPGARVMFQHAYRKIKEFESQVQVLENGEVVKEHVIQVNRPLTHEGIVVSQSGYDERTLRYSDLGVSRDHGMWFVFAGFLATTIGLVGRIYIKPALRELRARTKHQGDDRGQD